ncbi:uncharacterized protein LOC141899326 [Tubulanus polymorphus]|uniref:uncharacterized protein LOC141899326 n=1 Tax=Tubulanus polymorphus TaxID=672921 RepID=UPI003DA328AE
MSHKNKNNSASANHRLEGNSHYVEALRNGINPSVSEVRLQKAINCYYLAEQTSNTDEEKASASKNYAMASWKIAHVKWARGEKIILVTHNFKEAIDYFMRAQRAGNSKNLTWWQKLEASITECLDAVFEYLLANYSKGQERGRQLETFARLLPDGISKAKCYLEIARGFFHQGIEDISNGIYVTALSLMKECYYPIEEAARLGRHDVELSSDVRIQREDVFNNQCIAESMQSRQQGDDMYKVLLMDTEELSMDLAWNVIDCYTQAIVQTRNMSIENEAAALSRLGRVYSVVLKMKHKAKDLFQKSIELALTMVPCSPEREEWFQEAKAFVSKYQLEKQEEENKKWENLRKPFRDEIDAEIRKLDELANKRDEKKLLSYIYKTYPPKDKGVVVLPSGENWDMSTSKKAITKALIHYHPDKIDMEKFGIKWKVICEEITKVLNNRFTCYK